MQEITNSGASLAYPVNNNQSDANAVVGVKARQAEPTTDANIPATNKVTDVIKANAEQADTESKVEVNNKIEQTVAEIQEHLANTDIKLSFSIDKATERQVVTVKDQVSGDVIRQIPSEELLNIAAQLKEINADNGKSVGLLINGLV